MTERRGDRVNRAGDPPVGLEIDGRIARITLAHRPVNVLDLPTIARLAEALDAVAGSTAAVLVIAPARGLPFSAGVDVAAHAPDRAAEMLAAFHGLFHRLDALPLAVIAAVSGHALGGGMELALFADLVVAEEDALFGQPEIDVGCFPPVAVGYGQRLLGPHVTAELVLAGKRLSARRLHELGAVNRLAPSGALDDVASALAVEVAAKSRAVLAVARRALRGGRDRPFADALGAAERLYLTELVATRDAGEGVAAFLDGRPPRWEDR